MLLLQDVDNMNMTGFDPGQSPLTELPLTLHSYNHPRLPPVWQAAPAPIQGATPADVIRQVAIMVTSSSLVLAQWGWGSRKYPWLSDVEVSTSSQCSSSNPEVTWCQWYSSGRSRCCSDVTVWVGIECGAETASVCVTETPEEEQ